MGLYDKFINTIKTIDKAVNKPTQPKAKPGLKEYTFTLKEHFKGFKSFPIVVYSSKNKEAMINNNRLSDSLPGKEIKFIECLNDNNEIYLRVYIDNLFIGWIYEEWQLKQISKIEAIAAKLEIKPYPSEFDKNRNAQRIKLFVKLINN